MAEEVQEGALYEGGISEGDLGKVRAGLCITSEVRIAQRL